MATFTLSNRYKIRAKSPVEVVRCLRPTEPFHMTRSLPPLDGAGIESGMVVVIDAGTYRGNPVSGFRKGQPTDTGKTFYIALHDQESHDVQQSGKMVAMPCREDIELQTGHYEGGPFTLGAPLTVGDDGVLTLADETGKVVVGHISAVGPLASGAFSSPSKTRPVHVEDPTVIQLITGEYGATFSFPPNVLLDEFGAPILDEFGNPILIE